ncbi:MAG: class I SAM-dependent methyltransferase [Candidatus Nanohaloarchaea archaeon]
MSSLELPLANYEDDFRHIAENYEETLRVLDIGCGDFDYREDIKGYLKGVVSDVTGEKPEIEFYGIDIDEERISDAELDHAETADVREGLQYQDDFFDAVISNHAMCQLEPEETETVWQESERVVKDHGLVLHGPHNIRSNS